MSLGWGEAPGGPASFPDDYLTDPDEESETGVRVALDEDRAPWLEAVPDNVTGIYGLLHGLDGWGTSASVFLRFSGPVEGLAVGRGESGSQDGILFVALTPEGPEEVPFESWTLDGGATVMVRPLRPLAPQTRHGVAIIRAVAEDGGCVGPSAGLRRVLSLQGEGAPEVALQSRWGQLLASVGKRPQEVSGGVVFTTGSRFAQAVGIAKDIEERSLSWSEEPACVVDEGMRICQGTLEAWDYRTERVLVGTEPVAPWDLDVNVWLPEDPGVAYPMVLYGHGLNSDRGAGVNLARILAPLGVGVVAVDALHHGSHPTVEDNITSLAVFDFIAVEPELLTVDVARLQANFLQSAFDKLQVLKMVAAEPDIDGDGSEDVEVDTMGYYGVSLGGIRASHILALSGRLKVGVISVGGARLGTIIEHGADFGIIRFFMEEVLGGPDEAARFYPVMQAAGDGGDPVTFAPRVLGERLVGVHRPHILLTAALGDFSVPNEASNDLSRALGIPVLGVDHMGVGLVDTVASGSVKGNLEGGTTGAFFQLDRVSTPDGGVVSANHDNATWAPEAVVQLEHFISTWLDDGVPEVLNSYETLGTPPLH